jgi:transposase
VDADGYDAGKKINGKKCHILVDTLGLVLHAIVHPANIQDRDRGGLLLAALFGRWAFLEKLFTDGGYADSVFQAGAREAIAKLKVEFVKRSDAAKGFEALPKRRIVERTVA